MKSVYLSIPRVLSSIHQTIAVGFAAHIQKFDISPLVEQRINL